MRLLVSVSTPADARAALAGGADIIDAKDPSAGALGAVSLDTFRCIADAVPHGMTLTAALDDAAEELGIAQLAEAFTAAGADFVKIGIPAGGDARRASSLLDAAINGAQRGRARRTRPPLMDGAVGTIGVRRSGVVAVGYADAPRAEAALDDLRRLAAQAGADGVLVDTTRKDGPGLARVLTPVALADWVRHVQDAGLIVAIAGRLMPDDGEYVSRSCADIAGVRGAVCAGGRTGCVEEERVRRVRRAFGIGSGTGDMTAGRKGPPYVMPVASSA